jgi:hypothetical protein
MLEPSEDALRELLAAYTGLIGYLARAQSIENKFKHRSFRAADGYAELTIFAAMPAGQGKGTFAVYQAGDIGCARLGQFVD